MNECSDTSKRHPDKQNAVVLSHYILVTMSLGQILDERHKNLFFSVTKHLNIYIFFKWKGSCIVAGSFDYSESSGGGQREEFCWETPLSWKEFFIFIPELAAS